MRTNKRVRTVLYGDQRLSSAELEVVHTPAMQRLYGLRQLGLTDRVYIDASHARIHHVVGVLHQVDKLVFAIVNNLRRSSRELRISTPNGSTRIVLASNFAQYVRTRRPVIRFIGLLHDLTHAPFGHTIEDEIKLVDQKHDDPKRQAGAFYRLLCQLVAWLSVEANDQGLRHLPESLRPFLSQGATAKPPSASEVGAVAHELISGRSASKKVMCLKVSPKDIAEMLAHLSYAMTALLHLDILHAQDPKKTDPPDNSEYPFQELVRIALEGTEFAALTEEFRFEPQRDAFMLDVVGNTVCADLLDYAGRDSHYAGLRLNYDPDRITENFTLISKNRPNEDDGQEDSDGGARSASKGGDGPRNPFHGYCLRTAISLESHKYRTDVPSELMNLLNVRFYLYERVIFHPTKCAAGSMLGTALQLLGWRKGESGDTPRLPQHLQFVGDDVFLHDIRAALDLALRIIEKIPEDARIEDRHFAATAQMDGVHNGLVPELLKLRRDQVKSDALAELEAAKLLMNRLMSRRYFRPIFRALPNTEEATLGADRRLLARLFSQPDQRYKAEREIERRAGLTIGTITIHCPGENTAQKIANVFLTRPDTTSGGAVDKICKLNTIASLDGETFREHEKAVKAVEDMYKSMWRLSVYVAPEHVDRWKEISGAAGRVIFEISDVDHGFDDQPDKKWQNDPNLVRELEGKTGAASGSYGGGLDLTPLGEITGQIADGLVDSGRIRSLPSDLYDREVGLTDKGRKRIEDALVVALNGAEREAAGELFRSSPPPRAVQLLTFVKSYVKRPKKKDERAFLQVYPPQLDGLTEEQFAWVASKFEAAVAQSEEIDEHAPAHKGYMFDQCAELLDELIRATATRSVASPNRGAFGKYGG